MEEFEMHLAYAMTDQVAEENEAQFEHAAEQISNFLEKQVVRKLRDGFCFWRALCETFQVNDRYVAPFAAMCVLRIGELGSSKTASNHCSDCGVLDCELLVVASPPSSSS